MHQLERPLGPTLCLLRERRVPAVAGKTPIAELIYLNNLRKTVHPSSSCHLLDSLEVEVAKVSMPPQCHFLFTHEQTNWVCDIGVEHIQPIQRARNSCQYPIIYILDTHNTLFNENLVPNLVELADAENGHLEHGDEVDT
jgi:hypothetical protein